MRNAFLISVILFLSISCSETHKMLKKAEALSNCEKKWQYFKLNHTIKGMVLSYTKGYCGNAHIHTNTIIITNDMDTIRVDGPCYTENAAVSDSVLVSPYETDNVIGAIGDGKYDCKILKTCYGIVKKIK